MNREKILEIAGKCLAYGACDGSSTWVGDSNEMELFANAIIEAHEADRPKCPECGDLEAASPAMHRCNNCGWEWFPSDRLK